MEQMHNKHGRVQGTKKNTFLMNEFTEPESPTLVSCKVINWNDRKQ